MRKLARVLIILSFFLFLSELAFAQTRGEGVGAFFSNTQGDTTVSISNVKTAPWSEVIVENGAGEMQAVAKLDEKGRVNFTFEAVSADVGNLYIYAVDEAGVTNKISIPGTSLSDEVLPPTLVSKEEDTLPENSAKFAGFSYPGASVSVHLTSDQGYDQTFSDTADATSGAWEITVDALEGGSYTASAIADVSGETSQKSQELHFEIAAGGIVGQVVEQVGQVIEDLAAGAEEAVQDIIAAIQNLPESIKQASNTASKAAVPLSFLGLLLQAGVFNIGDFLTLLSRFSVLLRGAPLIPILASRRKRKRPWGVAYDSITKNPLSNVLVRLFSKEGNQADMEITDQAGGFSLLPQEGEYRLEALRPGYVFPTQIVRGGEDGEYENIYSGGNIQTTVENPVVNLSVPLDPSHVAHPSKLKSIFRSHGSHINMVLLTSGVATSTVAYVSFPTVYNQVIGLVYIFVLALLAANTVKFEQSWGIVKDAGGKPAPSIILSLVDAETGRSIKRRITNERGRYQFAAPRGRYRILISSIDWERAVDADYYTGDVIELKDEAGLINPPIKVAKKPETALKRRETL
jgi:hypothetical protein